MNESASRLSALILPLLALLAAACSGAPSQEPPLKGARIGGPFALVDQHNRGVSEADFKGKYRLVYFGYTYCPDVCPVDLQLIGQGLRKFEKDEPTLAQRVQPIFITTDPERDTPEVLRQFVASFHPRLIGLTGTPEQIKAVAKSYGSWAEKQTDARASGYLVNHARTALLFGPEGEPITIVPHDQGADAVAAELERWVT